MKPLVLVNVHDVADPDSFVDLAEIDGRPVHWLGHSGLPANAIERRVRRPRLSRYRAAAGAARDARHADAMISSLPRMSAAVERFMGTPLGPRLPHLAFTFNFTALPVGNDLRRMRAALTPVEQFCVFSQFEVDRYAELFEIPAERFRPVIWTQPVPIANTDVAVPERPYVAAIGGEGRDFATLLDAARATPELDWIVIARPNALLETAPANVKVRYNVPHAQTWGIAAQAAATVVPLLSEDTCCGHLTLVSAQQLGLPLLTSRSRATREYVEGRAGTTLFEPGDAAALAALATAHAADPGRKAVAQAERAAAVARYDRSQWNDYIADFVRREVL